MADELTENNPEEPKQEALTAGDPEGTKPEEDMPDEVDCSGDLDLRKMKTLSPLLAAGFVGGICHPGVNFITSKNVCGFDSPSDFSPSPLPSPTSSPSPVSTASIATLPETPTKTDTPIVGCETGWYILFSIIVGTFIGPAAAMASIGMPTRRNLNRLLISSILLGAFLPSTITTLQEGVESNQAQAKKEAQLQERDAEIEANREATFEASKQALADAESLSLVGTDNNIRFEVLRLRLIALQTNACSSNNRATISKSIEDLNSIRRDIGSADSDERRASANRQIDLVGSRVENCLADAPVIKPTPVPTPALNPSPAEPSQDAAPPTDGSAPPPEEEEEGE